MDLACPGAGVPAGLTGYPLQRGTSPAPLGEGQGAGTCSVQPQQRAVRPLRVRGPLQPQIRSQGSPGQRCGVVPPRPGDHCERSGGRQPLGLGDRKRRPDPACLRNHPAHLRLPRSHAASIDRSAVGADRTEEVGSRRHRRDANGVPAQAQRDRTPTPTVLYVLGPVRTGRTTGVREDVVPDEQLWIHRGTAARRLRPAAVGEPRHHRQGRDGRHRRRLCISDHARGRECAVREPG